METGSWQRFTKFSGESYTSSVTKLNDIELKVIHSTTGGNFNYKFFADLEQQLIDGKLKYTGLILEVLQKARNIGANVNVDQEDVLITKFVEPLIMSSLEKIENTTIHGNGHPLHESYVRKIARAKKHGFPTKNVRRRAPNRTTELHSSGKDYSVMVMEVKTTKNASQHPDHVKMVTFMKDTYDFAASKGVEHN